MRSQRGSIFKLKSQNKYLLLAGVASFILTTAVIFIKFMRNAFGFAQINVQEYFVALGLAVLVIPIVEIVKVLERAFTKKKNK